MESTISTHFFGHFFRKASEPCLELGGRENQRTTQNPRYTQRKLQPVLPSVCSFLQPSEPFLRKKYCIWSSRTPSFLRNLLQGLLERVLRRRQDSGLSKTQGLRSGRMAGTQGWHPAVFGRPYWYQQVAPAADLPPPPQRVLSPGPGSAGVDPEDPGGCGAGP